MGTVSGRRCSPDFTISELYKAGRLQRSLERIAPLEGEERRREADAAVELIRDLWLREAFLRVLPFIPPVAEQFFYLTYYSSLLRNETPDTELRQDDHPTMTFRRIACMARDITSHVPLMGWIRQTQDAGVVPGLLETVARGDEDFLSKFPWGHAVELGAATAASNQEILFEGFLGFVERTPCLPVNVAEAFGVDCHLPAPMFADILNRELADFLTNESPGRGGGQRAADPVTWLANAKADPRYSSLALVDVVFESASDEETVRSQMQAAMSSLDYRRVGDLIRRIRFTFPGEAANGSEQSLLRTLAIKLFMGRAALDEPALARRVIEEREPLSLQSLGNAAGLPDSPETDPRLLERCPSLPFFLAAVTLGGTYRNFLDFIGTPLTLDLHEVHVITVPRCRSVADIALELVRAGEQLRMERNLSPRERLRRLMNEGLSLLISRNAHGNIIILKRSTDPKSLDSEKLRRLIQPVFTVIRQTERDVDIRESALRAEESAARAEAQAREKEAIAVQDSNRWSCAMHAIKNQISWPVATFSTIESMPAEIKAAAQNARAASDPVERAMWLDHVSAYVETLERTVAEISYPLKATQSSVAFQSDLGANKPSPIYRLPSVSSLFQLCRRVLGATRISLQPGSMAEGWYLPFLVADESFAKEAAIALADVAFVELLRTLIANYERHADSSVAPGGEMRLWTTPKLWPHHVCFLYQTNAIRRRQASHAGTRMDIENNVIKNLSLNFCLSNPTLRESDFHKAGEFLEQLRSAKDPCFAALQHDLLSVLPHFFDALDSHRERPAQALAEALNPLLSLPPRLLRDGQVPISAPLAARAALQPSGIELQRLNRALLEEVFGDHLERLQTTLSNLSTETRLAALSFLAERVCGHVAATSTGRFRQVEGTLLYEAASTKRLSQWSYDACYRTNLALEHDARTWHMLLVLRFAPVSNTSGLSPMLKYAPADQLQ
ncbi:MAG TPA: hypothetical protein PKJ98_11415 [Verrucomicrobiota bacterium]|nr:hypothetical protein [Verrucomicrobiota bacterium]